MVSFESKMFLKVLPAVVFLLLHIGQCYGNKVCDKLRHYLIVDKNGKVIVCNQCYKCKPGKEPVPSCGAFVGITEVLGKCHPCKDGFYSGNDDMLPCQPCKSLKCLKLHLKVGGECKINKPDASYCTGECEEGYLMNSNETACEPYKPRLSTTKTADKTVGSTTSKGNEESHQSLLVVYIPCGVLIFLVIVVIVVCYCLYSRRVKAQVVLEEQGSSANTSTELLEKEEQLPKTIIKQEESQYDNGQLKENKYHCPETSHGTVSTTPESNESVVLNMSVPSQEKTPFTSTEMSTVHMAGGEI